MAKYKKRNSVSWGTKVTTTASITLVLLLLGLTTLVGFMGNRLSHFVKENLTVTIELPDKIKDAEIKKTQENLEKSSFVKKVTYISKDKIKEQLIADLGSDPEEVVGYNPLSSCFEINLKAEYANTDSMKVVEKALKANSVAQSILYNQDDLNMVNSNLSKIGTTMLVLAIILMFISFTLIRNTIRLNIYSRRFTISTMQLVGATNSFIRKPFLRQTITCGVIAALLADALITAIVYMFTKEYGELISIVRLNDILFVYVIVLLLGILLTFTATYFAVNKYLRMNRNNLYYI